MFELPPPSLGCKDSPSPRSTAKLMDFFLGFWKTQIFTGRLGEWRVMILKGRLYWNTLVDLVQMNQQVFFFLAQVDFLGKKGWIAGRKVKDWEGGRSIVPLLHPDSFFCSFIIYPPSTGTLFGSKRHRLRHRYLLFTKSFLCFFLGMKSPSVCHRFAYDWRRWEGIPTSRCFQTISKIFCSTWKSSQRGHNKNSWLTTTCTLEDEHFAHVLMELWFRSYSFLNGWLVGSIWIFQDVHSGINSQIAGWKNPHLSW